MCASDATSADDRRGYSCAMIARLVGVPEPSIKRWVRRGYLTPLDTGDNLASFGFEQVRVAQTLAAMTRAGLSPGRIDRVVEQLGTAGEQRGTALAGLQFHVDGDDVVLQQEGEWAEPSGQLRLRFDHSSSEPAPEGAAIPFAAPMTEVEQLRLLAEDSMELGRLEQAEEACRGVLFSGHATPGDHLLLADALYRQGDLTAARERYLVCLEQDEDCLEARLSLGALYAELGSLDLADSALRGVLEMAPDSPDALIQLAELQDRLGKPDEACRLRRHLVQVAPEGPWSEQARARLTAADAPAQQLENPGR